MIYIISAIVIALASVCTYFNVRQQMKFNEIYAMCLAIRDMTDEKALEYAQYVVKALKENKTVLSYTAWNLRL